MMFSQSGLNESHSPTCASGKRWLAPVSCSCTNRGAPRSPLLPTRANSEPCLSAAPRSLPCPPPEESSTEKKQKSIQSVSEVGLSLVHFCCFPLFLALISEFLFRRSLTELWHSILKFWTLVWESSMPRRHPGVDRFSSRPLESLHMAVDLQIPGYLLALTVLLLVNCLRRSNSRSQLGPGDRDTKLGLTTGLK